MLKTNPYLSNKRFHQKGFAVRKTPPAAHSAYAKFIRRAEGDVGNMTNPHAIFL